MEQMRVFALRSVILVLSAACLFASTGLSQESNGFWPLSGEFSAEGTYVGEGDVERGGKRVNDFDEIDSDIRLVLTPRIKLGVLRLGMEWERFSFGLPEGAALPNTLQSFSTIIGLDTQWSDSILMRVEIQPGLYNSGLGHLFWDNFNMPFVIGGTYIFSPKPSAYSRCERQCRTEIPGASCRRCSLENSATMVAGCCPANAAS